MWRTIRCVTNSHFYAQIYFQMFPILLCSKWNAHGNVPKSTSCEAIMLLLLTSAPFLSNTRTDGVLRNFFEERLFLLCLLLNTHQDIHLKIAKNNSPGCAQRADCFSNAVSRAKQCSITYYEAIQKG